MFILPYTFILTLSVTQVTCEKKFSKWKTLKTRFRNTSFNRVNIVKFIMISIEKDKFMK